MSRFLRGALVVAVSGTVGFAPVPARAEDPLQTLAPCRRADLIGLWAVVRLGIARGAEVDRSDRAFSPHQRYVFHADATMLRATSTERFTPADDRALLAAPATTTWAVDVDGRLLLQEAGAIRLQISTCRVLTAEVRDPRSSVPALPGDLLLTEHDANDRPLARRLLRKLSVSPQPAE